MKGTKQARRDAKQLFRFCLSNGSLDEVRVRQVVNQVNGAKNRNRLHVLSQFLRLVKFESIRHTATVESATPLPADMQASVEAGLARMYGPGLNVSFIHNAALLGGMRIKVGSDVYDGSIQAKLAALEAQF